MESENDKIIKEEFENLKADIVEAYYDGGKETTGEFEKGLQLSFAPNKGNLSGYLYLAGRAAGKMPPIKAIEEWLKAKGIQPLEKAMKISSLAYLIARKIAREGTDEERHQHIYDQVITPDRIQTILERINKINVNWFIDEVKAELEKLVTNK
jgi:hypothetical protein